jgi:hypothetical protein
VEVGIPRLIYARQPAEFVHGDVTSFVNGLVGQHAPDAIPVEFELAQGVNEFHTTQGLSLSANKGRSTHVKFLVSAPVGFRHHAPNQRDQ